jgi:Tol biopolymer transport system component/predicted Ser/Thr protein kinase
MLPGDRLGPYEITAPVGAGGMGEVYRATDTRLKRQVAVKILPASFAADPDRLARFQREAEVLASLNHPNIAAIYGVEDGAIVMELVEGPTLADRIAQGAVPAEEVLPIAKQIAGALEAAHEQGIIHRDLKPANVKVRPDGTVKVLDFGLAKVRELPGTPGDPAESPTITSPAMTARGVVLGTAAYMAPEQARGRMVDKRADVWAFGAVVFEMLTGRRAFDGEDTSEILANILKHEPDLHAVPPAWRALLRRCLAKDPKKRLRDIGDAGLELDAIADPSREATPGDAALRRRMRVWQVAAIVMAAVAVGVAAWRFRNDGLTAPAVSATFDVPLPPERNLVMAGPTLAVAPDGRTLLFGTERSGQFELFRHNLDAIETKPLGSPGDTRAAVFSPDGRSLLVFSGRGLLGVMPVEGGPVRELCTSLGGAAWIDNSSVVGTRGGVFRTPTTTCVPEHLTRIEAASTVTHRWPAPISETNTILFTAVQVERGGPRIVAVDATTRQQHEVTEGTFPRFVPPNSLFFVRRRQDTGTAELVVAPFDTRTAKLAGPATALVDGVGLENSGAAHYAVSDAGTLAYALAAQPVVRIIDATGNAVTSFPVSHGADMIAVSPDGRRAVIASEFRIDLLDLERGTSDPLTFDAGQYKFPVWLPDGRRISYRYQAPGQSTYQIIVLDLASGTRKAVATVPSDPESGGVSAWSADMRTMFGNYASSRGDHDVFRFSLDGTGQLEPLLATPARELNVRVSPDGRLLAFAGGYQGPTEIFVQPLNGGERARVSTAGGLDPIWGKNGELFYRAGTQILSSNITIDGARVSAGTPKPVVQRPLFGRIWSYGVMPDGRRLVTLERGAPVRSVRVVLNWPRLLGR